MTERDNSRQDPSHDSEVVSDSLLALLPQRLRVALVLRDKAGLSDRAIAAHLRVGVAEVPGLIGEARVALRRLRERD